MIFATHHGTQKSAFHMVSADSRTEVLDSMSPDPVKID